MCQSLKCIYALKKTGQHLGITNICTNLISQVRILTQQYCTCMFNLQQLELIIFQVWYIVQYKTISL